MTSTRPALRGIHHVTAICGAPQPNVDFYAGLLGLRLVKRTVNYDDPGSYHLYYGDGVGSPGSLMTFFAWTSLPPLASGSGRAGTGAVARTALAIPADSLDLWIDRLAGLGVDFDGPAERRGLVTLGLRDPDGFALDLVAVDAPERRAFRPWTGGPVAPEHQIRGIHGVTISTARLDATRAFLTAALGMEPVSGDAGGALLTVGPASERGWVELDARSPGPVHRMGIGLVHHVAWRAADPEEQQRWRLELAKAGVFTTPVADRSYFESIYFHEPGGVELEIATDPPGFAIDEEDLGSALRLPAWLEPRRETIEARLPSISNPSAERAAR